MRLSATVLLASQLISKNEHMHTRAINTLDHGQCVEIQEKKSNTKQREIRNIRIILRFARFFLLRFIVTVYVFWVHNSLQNIEKERICCARRIIYSRVVEMWPVFKPFDCDFVRKNMKCRLGRNIKFDLLSTFEYYFCLKSRWARQYGQNNHFFEIKINNNKDRFGFENANEKKNERK